jgi:3-methyladenine DNA glycosylase Tag
MSTSTRVKPRRSAPSPPAFGAIRARAVKRKGSERILKSLLPAVSGAGALAALGDDRVLAEMTRRIFSAGFVWGVIEKKWPGFEVAFLGFQPKRLLAQPDEFWDALASDTRIVRNGAKIMAVRANAKFIASIAAEHRSFGNFLAAWPASDIVGLLDLLAKRGARLGGMTGQYLLRFLGKDTFITSRDVVACLRDAGLEIAEQPTSKRDLARIQEQFNAWAKATRLPLTHLSRICSMSIGENYDPETLRRYRGEE